MGQQLNLFSKLNKLFSRRKEINLKKYQKLNKLDPKLTESSH